MDGEGLCFASLADAVAALLAVAEPRALTRFEPVAADRVVIAINEAAAANAASPRPGDRPDLRRDQNRTADIELDYLYRQLVERGHARQVVVFDNRIAELAVTRVHIDGDDRVYGFVAPRYLDPPPAG